MGARLLATACLCVFVLLCLPAVALGNPVIATEVWPVRALLLLIPSIAASLPVALLVEPAAARLTVGRDAWVPQLRRRVVLINLLTNPILVILSVRLTNLVSDRVLPVERWEALSGRADLIAWADQWALLVILAILLVPLEIGVIAVEHRLLAKRLSPEYSSELLLRMVIVMNVVSFVVGLIVSVMVFAGTNAELMLAAALIAIVVCAVLAFDPSQSAKGIDEPITAADDL